MTRLVPLLGQGEVTEAPIAADRLIEGAPVARTTIEYETGKTYVGLWSSDIGAWRVAYDEWEYCTVLEGACELVPDAAPPRRFGVGDSFVVEPGFKGVWRVLAPMKKRFLVRLPD